MGGGPDGRAPRTMSLKSAGSTNRQADPPGRIALLVESAARGNQSAWEGLLNEFSPLVLGVARSHRLSEADVADVAQTTWMRLVEHLRRIEDPERVGGWLATTAARESQHVARKASRQLVTDDVPEPPAEEDVAQRLENAERHTALREAFRRRAPANRARLDCPGPT